jgi:hypothetical protein
MGCSSHVVHVLRHGLRIPVDWSQVHEFGRNSIKTSHEREWMRKYLAKEIAAGVIEEVKERPQVVSAIHLVPKSSEEYRLIEDLRTINGGIDSLHFRMETLARILPFLAAGMWACKLDLFHGYHHVPVHPNDRGLLGFEYEERYYRFRVLPFGLNIAPREFTKIVQEVVNMWRAKGYMVVFYIDDFLFLAWSPEQLSTIMDDVLRTLAELGWVVKLSKSVLVPTQLIYFLGFTLDFQRGEIRISQEKAADLIDFTDKLLSRYESKQQVNVSALAKLNGKAQFCSLACPWLKAFQHRINLV